MAKTRVEIKTPDFDKWKSAIDDLRIEAGNKVVEHAVETAPSNIGNYKSQIEFDGANTVTANAKYSAFLEYGTSEHGPVKAKALKFVKNGKVIFAKRVKGIKPFATMRNAAAQTQKEIPQIWNEVQRENGL